jgi:2-polyprenyl-3-methyl-5-hydroxy-6-metoxy-1,4-benzoquinol methylase
MPNLLQRSYAAELIDDLRLSSAALAQNLKELAFINHWLGGNAITTAALAQYLDKPVTQPYLIADLGCGGGDMLNTMANFCKKKDVNAQFIGLDANDFMVQYARNITQAYKNITIEQCDVFGENFSAKTFHIACLTLFCHHFTEAQLIQLFKTLKQNCSLGFVINDLHRHPIAYYSIWFLTSLFSKSYLVKNDARLSVWRGFKRSELVYILAQAGIKNYRISWRWAFRWQVTVQT